MSGRGLLAEVPAYANNARMFMFGNDYQWKQAAEPLDSNTGQVDAISVDSGSGAGIGMAFANRICTLRATDEVGLIPCAKGSTSIQQWRRTWSINSLYGSAIKRAYAAASNGTLAGLLFWQGESDTLKIYDAQAWPERFSNLIANFRQDLGDLNLPVVFGQLNSLTHPKHPHWQRLRNAQATISMNKVAMVDTHSDAAGWQADKVHAKTSQYQTIGIAFANAMNPLLS